MPEISPERILFVAIRIVSVMIKDIKLFPIQLDIYPWRNSSWESNLHNPMEEASEDSLSVLVINSSHQVSFT